jgi:hypothetical protein
MQIPQNPQFGPPRFTQMNPGGSPWMDALRRIAPMQPGFNPQALAGNTQAGQYSDAFRSLMQNSSGMQRAQAGSGFNPMSLFTGQRPAIRQNLPAQPQAGGITPQMLAQLRQQHIQKNRVPAARNPVY